MKNIYNNYTMLGRKRKIIILLAIGYLFLGNVFSQENKEIAVFFFEIGVEYYDLEEYQLASEMFEKCLLIYPAHDEAKKYLGLSAHHQKQGIIKFALDKMEGKKKKLDFCAPERISIDKKDLISREKPGKEIKKELASQKKIVSGQDDEARKKRIREFLLLTEDLYVNFGIQTGYIKGDSTYRITFDGGESELEFPIKNCLGGLKMNVSYQPLHPYLEYRREKASLNLSWLSSLYHSGKMKDSDWLDGDGHPGIDIYSESSSHMNLTYFDINGKYNFWLNENFSLGFMAGFRKHKYNYAISDTDQVGYGPYNPAYTTYVHGPTLVYSVRYDVPYFGVSNDLLFSEKLGFNVQFGYSPWAKSKDRDDHILRYKLSTAKCKGDAYFANINGWWNFNPDWHLNLGFEYADITTKGTQHQSYYDGPYAGWSADIDDEITSSYWLFSLALNYKI